MCAVNLYTWAGLGKLAGENGAVVMEVAGEPGGTKQIPDSTGSKKWQEKETCEIRDAAVWVFPPTVMNILQSLRMRMLSSFFSIMRL